MGPELPARTTGVYQRAPLARFSGDRLSASWKEASGERPGDERRCTAFCILCFADCKSERISQLLKARHARGVIVHVGQRIA